MEKIKLVKNRSPFWCEWELLKKRLKDVEPKCDCKKGNPDKGYHLASCPYLNFWNEKFLEFQRNYKPPKTLDTFVSNTTYKKQAGKPT